MPVARVSCFSMFFFGAEGLGRPEQPSNVGRAPVLPDAGRRPDANSSNQDGKVFEPVFVGWSAHLPAAEEVIRVVLFGALLPPRALLLEGKCRLLSPAFPLESARRLDALLHARQHDPERALRCLGALRRDLDSLFD